jgi:hypothetical protein
MKKAILTFGLFSMMMILTSFTSPIGGDDIGGPGNQGAPRPTDKEIGGPGNQGAPRGYATVEIGGPGNQGAPRTLDKEIGGGPGNQGAPRA